MNSKGILKECLPPGNVPKWGGVEALSKWICILANKKTWMRLMHNPGQGELLAGSMQISHVYGLQRICCVRLLDS